MYMYVCIFTYVYIYTDIYMRSDQNPHFVFCANAVLRWFAQLQSQHAT